MLIASADAASVKIASRILATGGLVAIPTETVYGLAASLDQESALKRIFEVKRRPSSHPLIVHVPDAETAVRYVRSFSPHATKLATAFWPGPLTLVLPRTELVPDCVTGSHIRLGSESQVIRSRCNCCANWGRRSRRRQLTGLPKSAPPEPLMWLSTSDMMST